MLLTCHLKHFFDSLIAGLILSFLLISFRIWPTPLSQKILNLNSIYPSFLSFCFSLSFLFFFELSVTTFHACLSFLSFFFSFVWVIYLFIILCSNLCGIKPYTNCDRDIFWQFCTEIFTQPCMKYNTSSESSFPPANCESESERSLRSDSGYVTEKAQQKPDFILKPHTVEVKAGGTAIFLCRITGSPSPSIKWETNRKTINNDERHKVKCILFFFEHLILIDHSHFSILQCTLES